VLPYLNVSNLKDNRVVFLPRKEENKGKEERKFTNVQSSKDTPLEGEEPMIQGFISKQH
jgi:hypothetical protein